MFHMFSREFREAKRTICSSFVLHSDENKLRFGFAFGLTAEYPATPAVFRDEVATRYSVRGELGAGLRSGYAVRDELKDL